MKYKAKTDDNQKIIVEILRKRGFQVLCTHAVGGGFPDLIINKNGHTYFVEVKAKKGTHTERQLQFYQDWLGTPIYTLRSEDEAMSFDP